MDNRPSQQQAEAAIEAAALPGAGGAAFENAAETASAASEPPPPPPLPAAGAAAAAAPRRGGTPAEEADKLPSPGARAVPNEEEEGEAAAAAEPSHLNRAAASRGFPEERGEAAAAASISSDEEEASRPRFRGARLGNCSSLLVSRSEEFALPRRTGEGLPSIRAARGERGGGSASQGEEGRSELELSKSEGEPSKSDGEPSRSEGDMMSFSSTSFTTGASAADSRGPPSDEDDDQGEADKDSSSQDPDPAAGGPPGGSSPPSVLAQVGTRIKRASLRKSLPKRRRSSANGRRRPDDLLPERPSYARVPSYMRRLDELTLNKLQFSRLGRLYGREGECRQVLAAWRDVGLAWVHAANAAAAAGAEAAPPPASSSPPPPGSRRVVVAIQGEAGAGKTRLAESVRLQVVGDGGLFLSGKFCQPIQSAEGQHQQQLQLRLLDPGQQPQHQHQPHKQLGGAEPYSAFASACFDLCQPPTPANPEPSRARRRRSVLFTSTVGQPQGGEGGGAQGGEEEESPLLLTHAQLLERVSKAVGDEDAAHLTRAIPGLAPLLGGRRGAGGGAAGAAAPPPPAPAEATELKKSDLQFKFAFRRLVRLVSKMKPVCLVLDDVQWADGGSLELLESLLCDPEESALMVIVCCRTDVPGAHVKTLDAIRAMGAAPGGGLRVDDVRVGNLDAEQINDLLADLLTLPAADTAELAACVRKKTLGNVFFVTQFLGMLQASKLLTYNLGTLRWTFNVAAIQDSMGATDNVANVVKVKFKHLPKSVVRVLPAMACLGLTVKVDVFDLALNHCEWPVEPEVSLNDEGARDPEDFHPLESKASLLLKRCEAEGLLEARIGHEEVSYRWVHDKIQEAAFSLIDDSALQELKLSIGKVLCERLDPEALEANVFLVANLLISVGPATGCTIFEEPVEVARLFHRAGSKAMNSSAFELAFGYLQAGIKVLPEDHWETYEALSLELYSTASEAAFCLGNFAVSRQYCDEAILRTSGRPLVDRRRVYDVMIACTAADQGIEAAFYACKNLLADLGCVFPRRWVAPLHAIAGLVRIKASRKRYSPEKILQLGELQDAKVIWIMNLLDRLATYAYVTDPTLLCVMLFRCINITLQEGICQHSPAMFALVGLLLSAFVNDYRRGHAFAAQAMDLLQQVKSAGKVEARVTFLAHAFVFHWTRPFQLSVKPLLASFSAGMASGDTESAALSMNIYLEYSFRMGTPLPILLEDYAHYTKFIRDANQTKILAVIVNLWQAILFLTGQNEFTGPLTGDVVNQDAALFEVAEEDFNYLFFAIYRMQMYVAFVLGKHLMVYQSIVRTGFCEGAYERIFPGILGLIHLYAYNGLSMYSLYRETNDKKYLKLAKKFAGTVKKWARSGNPNVGHYDALLDAEADALRGPKFHSTITSRFEAAIQYSGKCGLMHDRALAHERYSEYLSRLGAVRDEDASFQLNEAMRLYEEWGAHAKVKQLRQVHDARFGSPFSDDSVFFHVCPTELPAASAPRL